MSEMKMDARTHAPDPLWREEILAESVGCEWPIQTPFRELTCGRSAPENQYGLALCWQHSDGAVAFAIRALRDHRLTTRYHRDALIEVGLKDLQETAAQEMNDIQREHFAEVVDELILHRLTLGVSLSRKLSDALAKRLEEVLI